MCFSMNTENLAVQLGNLVEAMVEEKIIGPLMLNYFHADQFKVCRRTLTVRFPWGGSIRLNPLDMTLYVFFLQHPCGVRNEDLWQYYSCLLELYRYYAVSTDPDWTESVIDNLCDTQCNSNFQSELSRIRGRISQKLGALAASRFAINRNGRGVYRITALIG